MRDAGLTAPAGGPGELALLRRTAALIHADDRERAELYSALASSSGPSYEQLTLRGQRLARMLIFALWPDRGGFADWNGGFAHLRQHPAVVAEVQQLMAGAVDRAHQWHSPCLGV